MQCRFSEQAREERGHLQHAQHAEAFFPGHLAGIRGNPEKHEGNPTGS